MKHKLYNHLRKNYIRYSFIANLFSAVGVAGLALLGIMTDKMALVWLFSWGVTFASVFGLGRLLDQEIDDLDKVKEHLNELDNIIKDNPILNDQNKST